MRAVWRAFVVFALFASSPVELMFKRPHTRAERAAWLTTFCQRVLRVLGITYVTEGPVPAAGAVIANHLSFFDILLHSAMRPCVFVSKIELRKFPLIGWMSFMAGTVYVNRGAGGSAAAAAEGMGKGFRDGLPVVFFPEGTTSTDNTTVLPFRSGLLSQAIALGEPVWPSFTVYSISKRDIAAGRSAGQDVLWGDQSLLLMIWKFCSLHGVHGVVRFAEKPVAFSDAALANRKVAAEEARTAVLRLADAPGAWPPA